MKKIFTRPQDMPSLIWSLQLAINQWLSGRTQKVSVSEKHLIVHRRMCLGLFGLNEVKSD